MSRTPHILTTRSGCNGSTLQEPGWSGRHPSIRRSRDGHVPMSERAKRIFAWILFVAVSVIYFGGGYYFGVIDRPRRYPAPIDGSGHGVGSGRGTT